MPRAVIFQVMNQKVTHKYPSLVFPGYIYSGRGKTPNRFQVEPELELTRVFGPIANTILRGFPLTVVMIQVTSERARVTE
jgi:hypothetical protein